MNGSSDPPPKTVACSVLSFAIYIATGLAFLELLQSLSSQGHYKRSDCRFFTDLLSFFGLAFPGQEDLHFIKEAAIITSIAWEREVFIAALADELVWSY